MEDIVLYEDKRYCCGCGACKNVCPKHAIHMKEDEYGFVYPEIDNDLCVKCGMCKKVCGYQNTPEFNKVKKVYAVASKDEETLKKSASGGAFAEYAKSVLNNNGVVYGATMLNENGEFNPKHIRITRVSEIEKIQGSKYVQSSIEDIFKLLQKDLDNGVEVLFSGTPCQIAAIKTFLKKEYANLFLVEIICHGVPSKRFFNDYIKNLEKKRDKKVAKYWFRDKSKGQDMTTRIMFNNGEEYIANGNIMSYTGLFLKSLTYRINCYTCPFAKNDRIADITIGDYWGFHEEYPEYNQKNGLTNLAGVSCVLVNTDKGAELNDRIRNKFIILESEFKKVERHNEQLYRPSKYSENREKVLEGYKKEGYAFVEKFFYKHYKKSIIKSTISSFISKGTKQKIKKIIGKLKR